MKLAIMQPYFFPYLGYFQLISEVDKYILYDKLNYIKEGWVNRNRILISKQKESYISVPVKIKSSYKSIKDIEIDNTQNWRRKILNSIFLNYKKSNFFEEVFPIIERIINYKTSLLSDLNKQSIYEISLPLSIDQKLELNSAKYYFIEDVIKDINYSIDVDNKVKRIIEICKLENCNHFVNAIGGRTLYSKEQFSFFDINLNFIETSNVYYPQNSLEFIPNLSIIDVIMNCGFDYTKNNLLQMYRIV